MSFSSCAPSCNFLILQIMWLQKAVAFCMVKTLCRCVHHDKDIQSVLADRYSASAVKQKNLANAKRKSACIGKVLDSKIKSILYRL
ncbi:hypothetical protein DWQ65_10780 [Treponema phagedenis]|nr:hypothetical protein C5O78_10010 [Treponema phagedenis]QSI00531.1 hypothetical protein DWQ65_10780 [Treponema phagedenis]